MQGVIEEEAEQRCGGAAGLQRAVDRGAVRVAEEEDGIKLFYFRSVVAGEKKEATTVQEALRTKAISDEVYDVVKGLVDQMGWVIEPPSTSKLHQLGPGRQSPSSKHACSHVCLCCCSCSSSHPERTHAKHVYSCSYSYRSSHPEQSHRKRAHHCVCPCRSSHPEIMHMKQVLQQSSAITKHYAYRP